MYEDDNPTIDANGGMRAEGLAPPAERAMPDNETIVPKTLREYVADHQRLANCDTRVTKKGVPIAIEMCRVVYEAQRSLDYWEFEDFCREIGSPSVASIRKRIAIGKLYPRMKQYVEVWGEDQWNVMNVLPRGRFTKFDLVKFVREFDEALLEATQCGRPNTPMKRH